MTFKQNGHGVYKVFEKDRYIGRVEKYKEYYNLHPRPATYTNWRIYRPEQHGSEVNSSGRRPLAFSTRKAAAEALLKLQS